MLHLTHNILLTNADKEFQLNTWTKFFTATSWENTIMLTENTPYTSETTEASYQIYDDNVEEMKRRIEHNYYKQRNTTKKMYVELIAQNAEPVADLFLEYIALSTKQDSLLEDKNKTISKKDSLLFEKDALIAELQAQLAQQTQNN